MSVELIKPAVSTAHDNIIQFFKYTVLSLLLYVALNLTIEYIPGWLYETTSYIITAGLSIGMITFLIKLIPEGSKDTLEIFSGFTNERNWLKIVHLIIGNIVYAGIILLGLLLLIIPGIFFSYRLMFWNYFVIRDNMNFWDALKASWQITDGKVLETIWISIKLAFLNLIGLIPLGIGLFWTIPASAIALTRTFDRFEKEIS